LADPKWPVVKTEADVFQDQYYPAVHLNGAGSLFHGKDRKHFPFLTNHHHGGDAAGAFGSQPFTITTASSESSSKQSNGNCALSLLSDNPTPAQTAMIPTAQPLGAALQYSGAARLPDGGEVSLAGMSYVRLGDSSKQASIQTTSAGHIPAASPSPATPQLQYYYHVSAGDQGNNPDGAAIQALPYSSW
jgi:hypothetical protein